jgi:hypothetical protein
MYHHSVAGVRIVAAATVTHFSGDADRPCIVTTDSELPWTVFPGGLLFNMEVGEPVVAVLPSGSDSSSSGLSGSRLHNDIVLSAASLQHSQRQLRVVFDDLAAWDKRVTAEQRQQLDAADLDAITRILRDGWKEDLSCPYLDADATVGGDVQQQLRLFAQRADTGCKHQDSGCEELVNYVEGARDLAFWAAKVAAGGGRTAYTKLKKFAVSGICKVGVRAVRRDQSAASLAVLEEILRKKNESIKNSGMVTSLPPGELCSAGSLVNAL